MDKTLHLVALNIPWPPNYGGVIDIFYKLKALHAKGVKIILHSFEYERPKAEELEAFCEKTYYYRRKTGLLSNFTYLPYNVYSRKDKGLIANLLKDNFPILFEGLHTCYYLHDKRLSNRIKIFRSCNIEHDYYREIGSAEKNLIKKCFYYLEAFRFKMFEKNVRYADFIIAVSQSDTSYFQQTYAGNIVKFIPCFHENNEITSVTGQSDFILYHAKLSVKENEKAALYIIKHVFSKLPNTCIIAGMDPPESLFRAAAGHPNIQIIANPSGERMHKLIREAQVHLLVTFQDTGLKLKLLNSLFAGRHVVVNPLMIVGSGLDALCHIAHSPAQMVNTCRKLMLDTFTEEEIQKRKKILFPVYSNNYEAEQLIDLIFKDHRTRF